MITYGIWLDCDFEDILEILLYLGASIFTIIIDIALLPLELLAWIIYSLQQKRRRKKKEDKLWNYTSTRNQDWWN